MDKPVLKDSLRLFQCFGNIKSRSMFGGYGIFSGETMFALVVNNKLHLRANASNETGFKDAGLEPYIYKKRGFPVVTKHYAIPEEWWQQPEKILEHAKQSLEAAQVDKVTKTTTGPERIKDLPNLRLANERMLKKAGIATIEELKNAGSINAFKALQATHSGSLAIDMLWQLEGAISGRHWTVIPPERRQQLLNDLN
ncbi:DNA transformation protein [Photobacterium aquae]|uniref:DNA transformation protein n=1 Tax=Photobacterium aquae TaxID=1195763 RepID=A0A0J1H5W7_9GAMM|nr:TfoX/Sxy family DNA transformation protein [Photobacterium aquae]KLV07086.1 DNA transformation protein [Photobacterium aquae]